MSATPRRHVAFRVLLREALPPAVVAGVVAALVVGFVSGLGAGLSALVGVAITVAFFASGLLVVSRFVTDTSNPMLFMAVGMSVYLAQVILLFGVLLVARAVDVFDSRAAGIAMVVVVVVWQAAQMRAWRRARVPVYDSTDTDGAPETPSAGPSAPGSEGSS